MYARVAARAMDNDNPWLVKKEAPHGIRRHTPQFRQFRDRKMTLAVRRY
jgi:hypothetical protein